MHKFIVQKCSYLLYSAFLSNWRSSSSSSISLSRRADALLSRGTIWGRNVPTDVSHLNTVFMSYLLSWLSNQDEQGHTCGKSMNLFMNINWPPEGFLLTKYAQVSPGCLTHRGEHLRLLPTPTEHKVCVFKRLPWILTHFWLSHI